ncbi:MAG: ABC transporter substrate-binding protein [Oligoflexus sp.]
MIHAFQVISFFMLFLLLACFPVKGGEEEGTLSIAWESQVRTFDPRMAVDANSQYLEDLLHCSLISFDHKGESVPILASETPKWDSDTKLLVTIRKDARFSDGSIVRAADVVATYQSLLKNQSFARSMAFRDIEEVKVKGDLQVEFTLKQPDATFVSNLVVGILPEKIIKKADADISTSPGCGPFVIAKQTVNELTLVPNPHYSLSSKPKIPKVSIKIVRSEHTRFAKLRAGEIDIAQNNINRDTIEDVTRRYPNLEVLTQSALKTTYVGFNMKDPLTSKQKVRLAIAHAIDRPSIIKLLLAGLAEPANSLLPPKSFFYSDEVENPEYNPNLAEKILDEAGFKRDGKYRFRLSYKTTVDATRINIARAIASQLRKVGIEVLVEPMEWGRFKQDIEAGRVQMWGLTWVGFKDPDIFRYAFSSETIPPNGGNRGHYNNPKIDKLLNLGRITVDQKKRKEIYEEVQNILSKELPYIFLWHEQNFAVINKKVKGFKLYADGRLSSLSEVSLQK